MPSMSNQPHTAAQDNANLLDVSALTLHDLDDVDEHDGIRETPLTHALRRILDPDGAAVAGFTSFI